MSRSAIASALGGTRGRLLATVTVSILLLVTVAFAVGVVGVPSLEDVDAEFGEVTDSHTDVRATLTVENPNPIGATRADVSATYAVSMNGVEMATGESDSIELEPGVSTERVDAHLDNDRIPKWWVSHLENGERTEVVTEATLHSDVFDRSTRVTDERTIETDLVEAFESNETRPVNASYPLVDDPFVYVNETRANWGELSDDETELEVAIDVYNPQPYDVPVSTLRYELSMNGIVVGDGETDGERVLSAGETTTIETTTQIENDRLDDWWVTHVENDEVTDLRIEFEAAVEVSEGSELTLPLDSLTHEETLETDVWGNDSNATSEDAVL